MSFTGSCRILIIEAKNLRPTDYQKRHEFGKNSDKLIDPYISLDIDEKFIGKILSVKKISLRILMANEREIFSFLFLIYPVEFFSDNFDKNLKL